MKKLIFAIVFVLMSASVCLAVDVTLSWIAPADDRVTGYFVYYGTTNPPETEMDAGAATEQRISDLTGGDTYFFGAKSYDADGNTSTMSDIIEWTATAGPQTIKIPARPSEIRLLFE